MKPANKILAIAMAVVLSSYSCTVLGLDNDEDDNTSLYIVAAAAVLSSGCSSSFLNTSRFRHLVSATTTSCTLSNGSSTTCCKLTFKSNQVTDNGPFCPTTVGGAGGLGMYNGAGSAAGTGNNALYDMENNANNTNTNLWNAMETGGSSYNITSSADGLSGTISVLDPATGTGVGGNKYCLQATANDNLTVTYTIPLTPVALGSDDTISTVENIGISLDGIPITGDPPTVTSTQNNGSIPSLDDCGGHHDPTGYYHWHFVAESIQTILTANAGNGFTASCTNMTQSASALVGFAKDGYPIYAYQDSDGSTPGDLDSCSGHTKATTEYPSGTYHYHAKSSTARTSTNLPGCVKGASVTNNLTSS